MASTAKQIRYRLEWAAIVLMGKLIPLLPRFMLIYLARGLGALGYACDFRGRQTGLENVRAAVANGTLPAETDPAKLVRGSYEYFARSMCDLFWAKRLTKENHIDYIQLELEDPEGFREACEQGAIWVTPHYGNFEWISLMMGFRDHPFTLVAQDFKNPLLTDLFTGHREQSGHRVISSRRAMIRLLKVLKGGGNAAFLTDLTVPPDGAAVAVDCFGFTACVTGLHGFLKSRTGAVLIPGYSIPREDGGYLMRICKPLQVEPGATSAAIAQQCWDVFEPHIREFPEPWLWMYKHWRYRPRGDRGEGYPTYSNHSKKFDKWLEQAEGQAEE